MYIIGDFNISSQLLGDNHINKFGRQFSVLHKTWKIKWRGPHFPTFQGRKTATAPDKIFSNSKAYFNIFSAPGPPTPSDHTIMLVKISAAPIQVPIPERRSPRKTNWDSYTKDLESFKFISLNNKPTQTIDRALASVTTAMTPAIHSYPGPFSLLA